MLRFAFVALVLLPSLTTAFEPGDKVVCIRSCDIKDDKETWHLNVLRAKRVNRENDIAAWKEDIFFRTRA